VAARARVLAIASTYIGDIPTDAFLTGQWRLKRDADLLALVEMTSPRFYAALSEGTNTLADPRELWELCVDAFTRRAADGPTVLVLLGAADRSRRRGRAALRRQTLTGAFGIATRGYPRALLATKLDALRRRAAAGELVMADSGEVARAAAELAEVNDSQKTRDGQSGWYPLPPPGPGQAPAAIRALSDGGYRED
jgi:hypothetical protein